MKKSILITILAILTALSFVYSQLQKTEAVKQRQLADANAEQATEAMAQIKECKIETERQKLIAEECARTKK